MFGLPGTTFGKLPVSRKPVLDVSGLTLEKKSLRIQFINITSTCNLVWCSSHDMGLTWLFITLNIFTFNIELLLSSKHEIDTLLLQLGAWCAILIKPLLNLQWI